MINNSKLLKILNMVLKKAYGKDFIEDFKVVDYEEGNKKYEDKLGALIVEDEVGSVNQNNM